MELSHSEVVAIVGGMRDAGFEVSSLTHDGHLAFTCPPRSRLMFGAVIAGVVPSHYVPAMLLAARTAHIHGEQLLLHFPGYTIAR